jgi:hypothetical protein
MLPLHGDIPDPLNGEAFYILKEEHISPTLWRYTGRIGFGHVVPVHDEDCIQDFHIPYKSIDMTDIQFLYDTEKNEVRMECSLRGQMMAEEAAAIPNNVTYEVPTYEELGTMMREKYKALVPPLCAEDIQETLLDLQVSANDWRQSTDSYLYFRCPRSKDGIALTRAMAHILAGRPPFHIMYPLILDA